MTLGYLGQLDNGINDFAVPGGGCLQSHEGAQAKAELFLVNLCRNTSQHTTVLQPVQMLRDCSA
jgi:hypothetical protein